MEGSITRITCRRDAETIKVWLAVDVEGLEEEITIEYPNEQSLPPGTRKGAACIVRGVGQDANGYYCLSYTVKPHEPKFQIGHGALDDRKWIVVNAHTGKVVSRHTTKKRAQRQLKGLH